MVDRNIELVAQSYNSMCFQTETKYLKYSITGNPFNSGSVIFLGLIWGRISTPSQFKNEQKLPKFLVLHFGENFMNKNRKVTDAYKFA